MLVKISDVDDLFGVELTAHPPPIILKASHGLKMIGIDTAPIPAKVVELQRKWQASFMQGINCTDHDMI